MKACNLWQQQRFLLLRRLSQLSILALFWAGAHWQWPLLVGNLSSSELLDTVPLSDPFVSLQVWLAGHPLASSALVGTAIVAIGYALLGGRLYCSWVCPVNMVTDAAAWLRRALGLNKYSALDRRLRYWLLGAVLVVSAVSGYLVWELVNPVSALHRSIIFASGGGLVLAAAIFFFDLLISRNGWCGHLCPMGAFYSLLGKASLLHINAAERQRCDNCNDCYRVCPEVQVLKPVLKGEARGISPVIFDSACTNCARCIDVCDQQVFQLSLIKPGAHTPQLEKTP